MAKLATALLVLHALAASACAADSESSSGSRDIARLLDSDPRCVAASWRQGADGSTVEVSVTNACDRPLTCDIHLALATAAGPELFLDCSPRSLRVGRTDAVCRWTGQPAVGSGSGAVRCR